MASGRYAPFSHAGPPHLLAKIASFPRCYGPEFTSRHFLAWCLERKIEVVHIEPGKPVQNAHVESFHGKLQDECLNASWFQNLFDARAKIAAWRKEYNEERPHSSLGYATPVAFARRMTALRSPTAPCAPPFGQNPQGEAQAMNSGGDPKPEN